MRRLHLTGCTAMLCGLRSAHSNCSSDGRALEQILTVWRDTGRATPQATLVDTDPQETKPAGCFGHI
jgi:hypothetical protein